MKKIKSQWLGTALTAAIVSMGTIAEVDARGFRMEMLPSSAAVGAGCNLCHTTGGGTPRNDFGLAVEAIVMGGDRTEFWGPELAALDSDGDGVPNGVELGDPDGSWTAGSDQPSGNITHPGDAESFDADALTPTAVEESTWGKVKGFVQDLIE